MVNSLITIEVEKLDMISELLSILALKIRKELSHDKAEENE